MDLDTGTILKAEVRPGDEPDQKDLAAHVLKRRRTGTRPKTFPPEHLTIESATADKGYHAVEEMDFLQQEGIRTVIADPVSNRNMDKLTEAESKVVRSRQTEHQEQVGQGTVKEPGDAP